MINTRRLLIDKAQQGADDFLNFIRQNTQQEEIKMKPQKKKEKLLKGNKNKPLKIEPVKTNAKKHKSPSYMEQIGLKHPFSIGIFGETGSGKSVLGIQLVKNENMFGGFFDEIYLFSPTGKADDSFEILDLDEEHIITNDMVENLGEILEELHNNVEELGIMKAKKTLIIFEDLTSMKKLQNSKEFLQAFVQNRHLNLSTIAMCHKYKALNRTSRLNCGHLIMFPFSNSELDALREEHQPPFMTKEQFNKLVSIAHTPTAESPKPFLHINRRVDANIRFRKNLDELLKTGDQKEETPDNPRPDRIALGIKLKELITEYLETGDKKILQEIKKLKKIILKHNNINNGESV